MTRQGEMTLAPGSEAVVAMEPAQHDVSVQGINVASLIGQALERDASIDVLERLFALQERQRKVHAKQAFHAAMAAFKADCGPIVRNKLADIPGRDGRQGPKYWYATLDHIYAIVVPLLSKHGLHHDYETPEPRDGREGIACVISHVAGHEKRATRYSRPDGTGRKNDIQMQGSADSFLMRYTLVLALGLAQAIPDDDGRSSGVDRQTRAADERRMQQRAANKQKRAEAKAEGHTAAPASRDLASPKQLQRLLDISEDDALTEEQRLWLIGVAENPATTSGMAFKAREAAEASLAAARAAEDPGEPPDCEWEPGEYDRER